MKIATFNINNINSRLPNLLHWLKAASPDVVCLQELKATDKAFPATALCPTDTLYPECAHETFPRKILAGFESRRD